MKLALVSIGALTPLPSEDIIPTLPPHPEVAKHVEALAARGYRMAFLSACLQDDREAVVSWMEKHQLAGWHHSLYLRELNTIHVKGPFWATFVTALIALELHATEVLCIYPAADLLVSPFQQVLGQSMPPMTLKRSLVEAEGTSHA